MRLIHTSRLQMKEFFEASLPDYAILSHTWGDGEVSCQGFTQPECRSKPGWKKIEACCELAVGHGVEWAWIDTCCIDKTSSAELSEAINSMFRWYRKAAVCYVFLSDFDESSEWAGLAHCRWFTRGWTLQELLAPSKVEFYDMSLIFVGDRESLSHRISHITGNPTAYLQAEGADLSEACIAQRMFWTSRRQTTRPEDIAYCLLGILDINMPLLYGEGSKAFARLQQQILAQSSDESLFAWTLSDPEPCGMLARSPRDFAASGNVHRLITRPVRPPSMSTNQGLEFAVNMYTSRRWQDWINPSPPNRLQVPIACSLEVGIDRKRRLAIELTRPSADYWLWTRDPSASHLPCRRARIFQDLEAIFSGYTKINVASEPSIVPVIAQDRRSSFILTSVRIAAHLLVIPLLGMTINLPRSLDTTDAGNSGMLQDLALWIVLIWYWRLSKQNFWAIIVLIPVLAFFAPAAASSAILLIVALSGLHFAKEYGRR